MKLDPPANPNYAATVVRLPSLVDLSGCDNLVGAPLFGFQAIVDRSHIAGQLGIVFPTETQLSDDFCSNNGLYRHSEKNKDPDAKGYLEDSRRVRAIKLRGHRSDCLFMPIESLAYTGVDLHALKEGDTFDKLGAHEICKKYVIKVPGQNKQRAQEKKFNRVDPRLFPEHADTDNWFRNNWRIPDDQHVYVTQKVHGTSWRGTHTQVLRKLSLRERLARKLGVRVDVFEWDTVAGSRKVIKDPHNPDQDHYYSKDIWTEYLAKVESVIPEGFIVYGELVGYTSDGAEIQTNYTYEQAPGTCQLYVYRVAFVNVRGVVTDLSWPQVRQWCAERDLKHVPDLWEGPHRDFAPELWIDRRLADWWNEHADLIEPDFPRPLQLSGKKNLVDEGVCVRADGLQPIILKAKSPIFLAHETKLLDKGETNLEDVGSDTDGSE